MNEKGVYLNHGNVDNPCFDGVTRNCTTVAELPEVAIVKLGALKSAAEHSITLNGGTETTGHGGTTEHGPFKSVVDIDSSRIFLDYIIWTNGLSIPCRTNGGVAQYDGGTYYYEPKRCAGSNGDHWHVVW